MRGLKLKPGGIEAVLGSAKRFAGMTAKTSLLRTLALSLLACFLLIGCVIPLLKDGVTELDIALSSESNILLDQLSSLCSFDALAQQNLEPTGYVNDFANVISPDIEAKIEAIAREVKAKTSAEIVVATLPTTGGIDIHDYSVELFTRWGIGEKGKDNGILIVAAIQDRKLWIKTGYGLEHVIPDAVASRIYRSILRPHFQAEDYGGGLLAAVRLIALRIGESEGTTFASVDSLRVAVPSVVADRGAAPIAPFIVFGVMAVLITLLSMRGGSRGRGRTGFPFWTMGGFSGGMKGGSFGGGFGGFGGGSCGGGGAGGGW